MWLVPHDHIHDPHEPPLVLPAMDADLIKLVNKLQDTFANLGELGQRRETRGR